MIWLLERTTTCLLIEDWKHIFNNTPLSRQAVLLSTHTICFGLEIRNRGVACLNFSVCNCNCGDEVHGFMQIISNWEHFQIAYAASHRGLRYMPF